MKRVSNDCIRIETSLLKLRRQNTAIRAVINVEVKGKREASGKAVLIDQRRSRVRLFHDSDMLSYDFSKYSVVKPRLEGTEFEPARGKTLKQVVRQESGKIIFASNGQTDNLWCANSVIIADGEVIKRSAPGIRCNEFVPLEGSFPFLVFDRFWPGLAVVPFLDGKPVRDIPFRNGINGPVLFDRGRQIDHFISQARPNIRANELLWDPLINQAAMSVAGVTKEHDFIFVSLAGDPDKGNECTLGDVMLILHQFKTRDAILLGISGDVQQYIRLGGNKNSWLIAKARSGSTMARMFPSGRPLSNAIIVEERV